MLLETTPRLTACAASVDAGCCLSIAEIITAAAVRTHSQNVVELRLQRTGPAAHEGDVASHSGVDDVSLHRASNCLVNNGLHAAPDTVLELPNDEQTQHAGVLPLCQMLCCWVRLPQACNGQTAPMQASKPLDHGTVIKPQMTNRTSSQDMARLYIKYLKWTWSAEGTQRWC